MAKRIPWDEYEAAYLLDNCIKIETGEISEKEAISKISRDLRARAISSGMKIDDKFRNEAGISMQLAAMRECYFGRISGLTIGKIFKEIVKIYKKDKKTFGKILHSWQVEENEIKAKKIQPSWSQFQLWLRDSDYSEKTQDFFKILKKVETFAYIKRMIKKSLFELTNVKEIEQLKVEIQNPKGIGISSRKEVRDAYTALGLYCRFLMGEKPDKYFSPITLKTDLQKKRLNFYSKDKFLKWMLNEKKLSLRTSQVYSCAVAECERLADQLGLTSKKIYGVLADEAERTINLIRETEEYKEKARKYHRFIAGPSRYLEYMKDISKNETTFNYRKNRELELCKQVLSGEFPKGYRLGSKLDLRRFIARLNDLEGNTLYLDSSDLTRKIIEERLLSVGIQYGNHVFAVDSLLSLDIKKHLLDYINQSFSQGRQVLYYQALFEEFDSQFLGQRIYNKDMLRAYLEHECNGAYNFEKNYMSVNRNIQLDLKDEVKNVLISQAVPIDRSKIYKALNNFPSNLIDSILKQNKEFICNKNTEYFHFSSIDLSDEELRNITKLVQQIINEQHFISGNEMIDVINEKYPTILERFSNFSQNGLRDAIAYYLGSKFSFKGNIISSSDKQLSMSEVFEWFAKSRENFTLDELNALKNAIKASVIYFDPIYENSLRISQEQFVTKDRANFDINKTDSAIASFCIGDYIPLSEINSFVGFPFFDFPWNIYLLEHYVSSYSAKFQLLHTGYNATKCVGAIVKKSANIDDFKVILTDVLANSNINLNPQNALQYLLDKGYLAIRRFSGIENIIIQAKAQRGW